MARFALSEATAADLREIADHTVAEWAAAYIDVLESRLSALAETPGAGRPRPELVEALRSFPSESHIVFYVGDADGIGSGPHPAPGPRR